MGNRSHWKSWKDLFSYIFGSIIKFQIFDGTCHTRDLGYMVDTESKGFAIDVNRESFNSFDYSALESLKNGFIVSGKYSGKCFRFPLNPVVVFSNSQPNTNKLSIDRWVVKTLGEGEFSELNKNAVINPCTQFPFIPPTSFPNLDDNFCLYDFITGLPHENELFSNRAQTVVTNHEHAGPSRDAIIQLSQNSLTQTPDEPASNHARPFLTCVIHPDQSKFVIKP